MSTVKIRTSFAAIFFLTACLTSGLARAQAATPDQATQATQQIVVTFRDRSLARTDFGRPGQQYAPTAGYGNSQWSARLTAVLAQDYHLMVATEWPIAALGVYCVVFEMTDRRDVEALMATIAADKRVDSVQKMNTFQVMSSDPYLPLQTNLLALDMRGLHRWTQGRNVTVAVVDTGIDTDHPDLRGQVTYTQDLVSLGLVSNQTDIHGTAVAGLIAASAENGEGITGVAPQARLVGLKACRQIAPDSPAAECNSLTLARALSAVLEIKPQVLNLSLGGPRDPLLSALLELVLQQGVVVVAAEPPPSNTPRGFPTDNPAVIRVSSSATGLASDADVLVAPGTEVLTTFPGGAYRFANGSSFAAAQVSGIAALLKELQPKISGAEIHDLLRASGHANSVVDTSASAIVTSSNVDACAAAARISDTITCEAAASLNRAADDNSAVPPVRPSVARDPRSVQHS